MSREKKEFLTARRIGSGSFLCLVLFFSVCSAGILCADTRERSLDENTLIAERVFKNECADEKDCLIEWNAGEDFLSLGLGHFIWYPDGKPGIFEESFQAFLQYARAAGEAFPEWLNKTPLPACPWATREQFIKSKESELYQDLLGFVQKTKHRQAEFLVGQVKKVLPNVIEAASFERRRVMEQNLSWLTRDAQGLYVIIDYVNFKGSGLKGSERYEGQGWGLLQVLQNMRDTKGVPEVLEEFARSAKEALTRRTVNAPPERNEQRWLPGWLRRIDTYYPRQD